MARVVETDEPVVREERTVVNNDGARSNTGTVIAVIVLILLLILLFAWRPWSGGSSSTGGSVNVTTPSTGTSSGQ